MHKVIHTIQNYLHIRLNNKSNYNKSLDIKATHNKNNRS